MPVAAGRLYGLGVGPGDPELLTLKALRLLRAVPVVAYPAPEHGDSFARSIVATWIEGRQREIAIRFPMRPGPPPVEIYDGAATGLAAELDDGRDVALLCQGDPLFYGSFINIFTRLAGRYRIEIIDLLEKPQLARGDQIIAIPTLVRKLPAPMKKIIGNLSIAERALVGLDLQPAK